jgi:hypothetical protein
MPALHETPCDAEVQVRQAAQPSERRRQGRRCSGTAGRPAARATPPGPTRCRGRGCCACGGEGRQLSQWAGAGEWGKRRSARGKAQGWTWRSREYSLPPWHRAHPHFPSSLPPVHQGVTKRHPPACRQGQYLSSSHWSLVRVARGPARLVPPSGPMPLFLREGRGGSRGVIRRGCWARCWQASHVESEAKKRPKQHCSAIDPHVLIFIGEPAASSQHHRHTRCDSLFSSPSTRDGQTLKLSRIGIFQKHKFRKLSGEVQ